MRKKYRILQEKFVPDRRNRLTFSTEDGYNKPMFDFRTESVYGQSPEGAAPPSDEELCRRAAFGDRSAEETLVRRHYRLVRSCTRPFFLAGCDSEDLIQEGMLGLLKAIREYDPRKEAAFRTFAELCVPSGLLTPRLRPRQT